MPAEPYLKLVAMTLARFFILCFAFLSLLLAGAGFWLYRDYPGNLESALTQTLSPYGITRVNLGALALDTDHLQLTGLVMAGTSAEQQFALEIKGLSIGYHWRDLLQKEVDSIEIQELALTLSPSEIATADGATSLPLNDYLPFKFLAALPLSTIKVHQWNIDGALVASGSAQYEQQALSVLAHTIQYGQSISAHLNSAQAEPLSVSLRVADKTGELGELQATLEIPTADTWNWRLQGAVQYIPLLQWLKSAEANTLLPSLTPPPSAINLKGASRFRGNITHAPQWPLPASGHAPPGVEVSGEIEAGHTVEHLGIDELLVLSDVEVATKISIRANALAITLDPLVASLLINPQKLGVSNEVRTWLKWTEVTPLAVALPEAARLDYHPDKHELALAINGLDLDFGNGFSRLKLSLSTMNGIFNTALPASAEIKMGGSLSTRLRRQPWPELDFNATAHGTSANNRIAITLNDVAESIAVKVSGTGNIDSGSGKFKLALETPALPYAVSSVTNPLKAYGMLEQDISIRAGQLQLNSAIEFVEFGRKKATQSSTLRASNISGQYGDYSFDNLNALFNWKGIEQWHTEQAATLTMDSVNVGFPVSNVTATLSLPEPTSPTSPTVKVHTFSSSVFGGEIYLPEPVTWRVGAASNQLLVSASQWELRQLVALQQGQEIDAQGLLEGQLPLIVEDGRIIIKKGFLRAIPPGGSIRYQATDSAAALAQSNEELGMALELLEDFRFKVLSTDVALDKTGNLHLGLALSGSNPTQFNGRQVNFNINLDQNIDPLLQSLRLSDTLVEQLERRIR